MKKTTAALLIKAAGVSAPLTVELPKRQKEDQVGEQKRKRDLGRHQEDWRMAPQRRRLHGQRNGGKRLPSDRNLQSHRIDHRQQNSQGSR